MSNRSSFAQYSHQHLLIHSYLNLYSHSSSRDLIELFCKFLCLANTLQLLLYKISSHHYYTIIIEYIYFVNIICLTCFLHNYRAIISDVFSSFLIINFASREINHHQHQMNYDDRQSKLRLLTSRKYDSKNYCTFPSRNTCDRRGESHFLIH